VVRVAQTPANTVLAVTFCPLAGSTGPKLFADKTRLPVRDRDTTGDAIDGSGRSPSHVQEADRPDISVPPDVPAKLKVKGVTETRTSSSEAARCFAGLLATTRSSSF